LNQDSESYNHQDDSVTASVMPANNHETLSIIVILLFSLILLSSFAFLAIIYLRQWQRRSRFFAHARLNENVEEITNPIFDFSATDGEDIVIGPVTNVSTSDDKVCCACLRRKKLILIG